MVIRNDNNRNSKGQFVTHNQAHLVHGGEGAIRRVKTDEPFLGVARETELAVSAELEEKGRFHMVRRNAIRLQTCADLYWAAISRLAELVAEKGPDGAAIVKLDKYIARFGWLSGCSLRAWQQVQQEERDGNDAVILDAIKEARGDD